MSCSAPAFASTLLPKPVYNTGAGATLPMLQSSAVSTCKSGDNKQCAQTVAQLAFNAKAVSMGRTETPLTMVPSMRPHGSLGFGSYAISPITPQQYNTFTMVSNSQVAETNCKDKHCCGTTNASCNSCYGANVTTLNDRL